MHPRLSVSAASSLLQSFDDDLAMWESLGVRHVGLAQHKLEAHGIDAALAAVEERGLLVSSVLSGWFDLRDPSTWSATQREILDAAETAARVGAECVYFPTGAADGRGWEVLCDAFVEAVAPCLDEARDFGVLLALEPSIRPEVSFVHTLHDALIVTERTGLSLAADVASCWMERGLHEVVAEVVGSMTLLQVSDVHIGAVPSPVAFDPATHGSRGRVAPGEGDLDLERLLCLFLDTGYEGPIEIEIVGPSNPPSAYRETVRVAVEGFSALLEALGA